MYVPSYESNAIGHFLLHFTPDQAQNNFLDVSDRGRLKTRPYETTNKITAVQNVARFFALDLQEQEGAFQMDHPTILLTPYR